MTSRRSFLGALAAVSFLGRVAKAGGDAPRISLTRPTQVGVRGVSFFQPEDNWNKLFPDQGIRLAGYAGDQDIKCICFEADLAGGWVGVYDHGFDTSGTLALTEYGSCTPFTYWVIGSVSRISSGGAMKPYPGSKSHWVKNPVFEEYARRKDGTAVRVERTYRPEGQRDVSRVLRDIQTGIENLTAAVRNTVSD